MRIELLLAVLTAVTGAPSLSVDIRDIAAEQPPQVHVLLRVHDAQGDPIAGLSPANFKLFEDDVPIPSFQLRQSHPDAEPVAVSVLLDTSGSMQPADVANAVAGATALAGQLAPEDPLEIVAFNSEITHVKRYDQPFDPAVLAALVPRGDTKLNDAVNGALERIAAQGASKRAIVLLTDGVDDGSAAPAEAVLARAAASGVAVHAIGLGAADTAMLTALSSATGGAFHPAKESSQLQGLYAVIASSLLTEYRLTYSSAGALGAHRLSGVVTVGDQQAVFTKEFMLGALPPEEKPRGGGWMSVLLAALAIAAMVLALLSVVILSRRGRAAPPDPADAPSPGLPFGTPVQWYHLVGAEGVFPISGRLIVGRDALADVVVGDDTVSRSHAQLEECDDGVLVQDLGSSNGTRVNGEMISVQVARAGDRIAFGDLDFELRAPTA